MQSRPNAGTAWVRAVLYMNEDTKEASNVFWFDPGFGYVISFSSLALDTHDLVLALKTALLPILSSSVTIRGGYVEWSDGGTAIGIQSYQPAAGGITGDALPEDVAAVVQKITAGSGPSYRGRWYFSGIPESFSTGSYLNTGTGKPAMILAAASLLAPLSIGSNTLTPAHFGPSTSSFGHIILTNEVDLLATRRRRRGVF